MIPDVLLQTADPLEGTDQSMSLVVGCCCCNQEGRVQMMSAVAVRIDHLHEMTVDSGLMALVQIAMVEEHQ